MSIEAGSSAGVGMYRERLSSRLVAIVVVILILVEGGWQWDISYLRRPGGASSEMNPVAALCLLSCSISFLLSSFSGKTSLIKGAGYLLAAIPLTIGLARLTEHFVQAPAWVDVTLYKKILEADLKSGINGRMTFCEVIGVASWSAALLLFHAERRAGIMQGLALVMGSMGLLAVLGGIYGVKEFQGLFYYHPMPITTAVCFLLATTCMLTSSADRGMIRSVSDGGTGAIMARRLIPFALIIPAVLGWLRLYSARNGAFTVEFGVSILVLGIIICFVFVILYNAMLLNKRDKEERKAREALHTSERISDHLITSIRDYAIFMLDTEGRIASWNGGAHAIKGYDATEVLGRPIDIFYTEEALLRNEPRENLRMASMHGSYRSEGWRVRKSGARFWADVLFTALHDTRGSLQGFVKVTRDISEQKKADDVIRHQAQLIEDISDAIISMDRDFCIISWNKAAERLYGYSVEEARGQDAGILLRSWLDREVRQEVRKLLREQGYWYGEVKHFTKANVALDVLVSVSGLRDEHNVVAGFVTVCRDISERRHAEQRLISFNEELTRQVNEKTEELRDIFERVTDAFTAFDKWGNIVYTNRRANEIMGPSAAKVGMNVWEYYPNTAKSGFKDAFDRAMATQQEQHLEVYAAAMNLWLEEHLYPSQKGVSLIFRDITEEKKVREDLSRSHEDMRALASHLQDIREEERAHIAREIHDELGQQLTGLKMDLGWIDDQLDRFKALVLRDRISGSLRLLDHTIMTVRKIAAELRPGILDDLGLVAAIEWHAEEFEKRSGIRARFRAGMPGRRYPSAMSIGLFRICQEALTNVARHSGAQHVDIFLGYEEDRIVLRVSDDGRGLPEEGHGVRKTLGLLGIKERAMMLGGILEVASKTGKGVILTVSVPIGISEQSS